MRTPERNLGEVLVGMAEQIATLEQQLAQAQAELVAQRHRIADLEAGIEAVREGSRP